MTETKKLIIDAGLEEKEADIYLAALSLGRATISSLAKKSGIKRPTAYEYVGGLEKRGLLFKAIDGRRAYYCPESPKQIIKILEEKKKNLEKFLPGLENLYASSFVRPDISHYEGRTGIKNIYQLITTTHKDVFSFFSPKSTFNLLTVEENHEILMNLRQNGGRLYNLMEKSEWAAKRLKMKGYEDFVKNKLLPEGFKFDSDLLISGDKIAIISFTSLMGVIITDRAIAELQKNTFKYIWKLIK